MSRSPKDGVGVQRMEWEAKGWSRRAKGWSRRSKDGVGGQRME